MRVMARASPATSMVVEEEVGARSRGQASRGTEVSMMWLLCWPRVD